MMTAKEAANLLRLLARQVPYARTKEGLRIRDASDFRAWLKELADEADQHSAKLPSRTTRRRLAS